MRFTRPTAQAARKAYACDLCGTTIAPGTVYERWRCFDVRDACTVRVHRDCWAAWSIVGEPGEWVDCPLLEWLRDKGRDAAVKALGDHGGVLYDRVTGVR